VGWPRNHLLLGLPPLDSLAPEEALAALGDTLGPLEALPAGREGPSAAAAWLGARLPHWRAQLQAAWTERLAEPWRARHEEAGQQRQRLAALRAQAECSSDEQLECLRLRARLEPTPGLADDVAAFSAAHAGMRPRCTWKAPCGWTRATRPAWC
jgi:hypothetical protein